MIHEFEELVPVETPLGFGYAMLYESGEHDSYLTVILESGALVTFTQDKVRVSRSYTHSRGISDAQMRKIVRKC